MRLRSTYKSREGYGPLFAYVAIGLMLCPAAATALLPTSPRVQKLVGAAVETLKSGERSHTNDSMLGGKCVVALALHKAGVKGHARIDQAVAACRASVDKAVQLDNYSHGLAIILLSELDPATHKSLIRQYIGALRNKQKQNGGWGYPQSGKGDTSQTQYAALALWEAHRAGLSLEPAMVHRLIDWLLATQDPNGSWGYQGNVGTDEKRAKQSKVTPTMVAAAAASLMITSDLHGLLNAGRMQQVAADPAGPALPRDVRVVTENTVRQAAALKGPTVPWDRVAGSLREGEKWMLDNDQMRPKTYACYYLYSIERYQSFLEVREGSPDLEPKWYEDGVSYLEEIQDNRGSWNQGCSALVDTAFAVLFLLRSTQTSLSGGIGEGAMVSGRGLPKNLAGAELRGGQVVVEVDEVGVKEFLSMIDQGEADRLDALAADPSSLVIGNLDQAGRARLEKSLRTGPADLRLLAARALARADTLDNAPALLYALTDPDDRVALAARDGLRFLARRPRGFELSDDFTEQERAEALEQWTRWYLTLRPEANLDLGR